jgi:hypothetical protein
MATMAGAYDYPPGVPEGSAWLELYSSQLLTSGPDAGNWEYVYDVWGGYNTWLKSVSLYYDTTQQVNLWYGTPYGTLTHSWCAMSAGYGIPLNGATYPESWPSNWGDTDGDFIPDGWVLVSGAWAYDNPWHTGTEYGTNTTDHHVWTGLEADENGLFFDNKNGFKTGLWMTEGLSLTFRVVHPNAPVPITWNVYGLIGTVLGPGPVPMTGDFDGDSDVDADDIDILADAIGAGSTDLTYDVNGDSVVDEQDLIDHIATLVERTDGGTGTYRGDFNLDGFVNGTDLAIFKAGFGLSGQGYAQGNANTDDVINGTDLAIFKATFGLSGTPGDGGNPPAVPEPATMALLAMGGAALLRRRK